MTSIVSLALVLQVCAAGVDGRIPGYDGKTRQVVERAIQEYGKLKSYQDQAIRQFDLKSDNPEFNTEEEPEQASLLFAAPNQFRLTCEEIEIVSDGKNLVRFISSLDQFVVKPAPKHLSLDSEEFKRFANYIQMQHPLFDHLLVQKPSPKTLIDKLQHFTETNEETLGGQAGQRVHGILEDPTLPEAVREVPFSAWFSESSGLMEELVIDLTKAAPFIVRSGPGEDPKIKKMVVTTRLKNIKLNADLPIEKFEFKPNAAAEEVEDFQQVDPETRQKRLIGKPAPEFAGKDLEGKTVRLSELKGKVILLDFWATWCGPCVMSMPGIQKISSKYAGKDVVVLGVNTNQGNAQKSVAQLLDSKKITYRQVLDPKGKISPAYRVAGIPYMVLIDKKGVIRDLRSGYSPIQETEIDRQIEQLLRN